MTLLLSLQVLQIASGIVLAYMLILPAIAFAAQYEWARLWVYRASFLIGAPTLGYSKWGLYAVFLGLFPLRMRSQEHPWDHSAHDYKEGLAKIRQNPSENFHVLFMED